MRRAGLTTLAMQTSGDNMPLTPFAPHGGTAGSDYPSNYHPNSNEHKDVTQTDRGGLEGFRGIRRKGTNAAKQIQGYEGPSPRGSASSAESYRNASIDKSLYQNMGSDRTGQRPLTGAPVGSEDGNKFTKMPSNRSRENNVGA